MLLYIFFFFMLLLGTSNPNEVCPENNVVIEQECFDFENSRSALSYQQANDFCNKHNKSLPVITDLNTMRLLVRRQLKKRFGSYWIGLEMKEDSWYYISDRKIANFSDYLIQNDNYNQDCAAILAHSDLHWGNEFCSEKYFYICKFSGNKCDDTELKHGNYCYTLSSKIANFDDSILKCNEMGGNLTEIYDKEEYEFLMESIKQDKSWMNTSEESFPKYYTDINSETIWLKAYFDEMKEYWDNSSVSSSQPRCLRSHNLNRIVEECDGKHFAICQLKNPSSTIDLSLNNNTLIATLEQTLVSENDMLNQSIVQENSTHFSEEHILENNTRADNNFENNATEEVMNTGIPTFDNETTPNNFTLNGIYNDNHTTTEPNVLKAETVDWKSFVIIAVIPASIALTLGVVIVCIKLCTTCYHKKRMDIDFPRQTVPLVSAKDRTTKL